MSDEKVGAYINARFVSSYQKVGSFRVVQGTKQGGNVASYFCTPDGRVVHIVAGPVSAEVLLREARWAVETHKLALLETGGNEKLLLAFYRRAHADRLKKEFGHDVFSNSNSYARSTLSGQAVVHQILLGHPLVRIEAIYKYVFERILGEKVSMDPVEFVSQK